MILLFQTEVYYLKPRRSEAPQFLKSKVFDQCLLPGMIYDTETRLLTIGPLRELKVTQRAMVRAMIGVSLQDHFKNIEIPAITEVTAIAQSVA